MEISARSVRKIKMMIALVAICVIGAFAGTSIYGNAVCYDNLKDVPLSDDISASLYKNGKLVITGKGSIKTGINYTALKDYNSKIKKVIYKGHITSTGDFQECNAMRQVVFCDSIMRVDDMAFRSCTQLKSIDLPDGVRTIGEGAFLDCVNLKTVDLGQKLKYIERFAFCECRSLNNLKVPDSVEFIGNQAFSGCISLEPAAIEKLKKAKKIDKKAFE